MSTDANKTADDVDSNALASWYRHVHPVLLIAIIYANLDGVVRDPLETLPKTAGLLAVLQVVYACLVLPNVNKPKAQSKRRGNVVESGALAFTVIVSGRHTF
jgi:hypothetical protein